MPRFSLLLILVALLLPSCKAISSLGPVMNTLGQGVVAYAAAKQARRSGQGAAAVDSLLTPDPGNDFQDPPLEPAVDPVDPAPMDMPMATAPTRSQHHTRNVNNLLNLLSRMSRKR